LETCEGEEEEKIKDFKDDTKAAAFLYFSFFLKFFS
jgi:hypothetical protein